MGIRYSYIIVTLVCRSISIAIYSGTNMYTEYLPIDLVICELHERRVIVYLLRSKRESYFVKFHTCINF